MKSLTVGRQGLETGIDQNHGKAATGHAGARRVADRWGFGRRRIRWCLVFATGDQLGIESGHHRHRLMLNGHRRFGKVGRRRRAKCQRDRNEREVQDHPECAERVSHDFTTLTPRTRPVVDLEQFGPRRTASPKSNMCEGSQRHQPSATCRMMSGRSGRPKTRHPPPSPPCPDHRRRLWSGGLQTFFFAALCPVGGIGGTGGRQSTEPPC